MSKPLAKEKVEYILELIGEGMSNAEIIAACKRDGIEVSRQTIRNFRHTRAVEIKDVIQRYEAEAIQSGLARRMERVAELKDIYARLKAELDAGALWVIHPRSMRGDEGYTIVEERIFNSNLIRELRQTLEDIAKEVGGRQSEDLLSGGSNLKGYMIVSPDAWPDKEEAK